jgi:hypothetical protein
MAKDIFILLKKIRNSKNDDREMKFDAEINKKDFNTCIWLNEEQIKLIHFRRESEYRQPKNTGSKSIGYAKLTSAGEKYIIDYQIANRQILQSWIIFAILILSLLINVLLFTSNLELKKSEAKQENVKLK